MNTLTGQSKTYNYLANKFITVSLSVFAVVLMILPVDLFSQGGLLVTPRRVVFDGSNKIEQLNLANTGNDTASYSISFVQYRMTEDGNFEEITEPIAGQNFSSDHLRLFPRNVTLAPSESQLVKVQIQDYKGLPDGEYRSHIYFRSVNKEKPLGTDDQPADTSTLSVKLIPVFGITIPAIIQKGEPNVQVTLSDLAFKVLNDTIPVLNMTFNRTGNMSVYGDIEVIHKSPDNIITQAGIVRGLAVYTPNSTRKFQLELNKSIDYSKGVLKVVYKTNSDIKTSIISEAEISL